MPAGTHHKHTLLNAYCNTHIERRLEQAVDRANLGRLAVRLGTGGGAAPEEGEREGEGGELHRVDLQF